MPEARIDIERAFGRLVLHVRGELDVAAAPLLDIRAGSVDGSGAVEVDLGDVTFADSAGITAVVDLLDRLRRWGLDVTVLRVPQPMMRLAGLLGCSDRFGPRPLGADTLALG